MPEARSRSRRRLWRDHYGVAVLEYFPFQSSHLRPTSDRVRESLFNILQTYQAPADMRVLDLFAGTGALGIEALSRGARSATFVENGRIALGLLRQNLRLCRVEAQVIARDARKLGKGTPHDLIFLDPPYGKGLGEVALSAVIEQGWLAPNALVVWEEGGDVQAPEGLRLCDERRYGDSVIRIFMQD